MASFSVILAEEIARCAHAGQKDKAGEPYIGHLERVVANLLSRWPDATDDEIATAWLHDVIEDTDWCSAMLLTAGIPVNAVLMIEEVTRPKELGYLVWIRDLATKGSLSAVKVKLADNRDNSTPERIAALGPLGQSMLRSRYVPARDMLEDRIARETFFVWLRSSDGGNCSEAKPVGDGLYVAIKPLMFHWTMIVGEIGDKYGYTDRWCYADQGKAEAAFHAWDGVGEPAGWHRHPMTGRRRTDGDPSKEYVAR